LQALVIRAGTAPGDFSAGAPDVQPIHKAVMPGSIIRPLADAIIQASPVVGGDGIAPIVKVREDAADRPEGSWCSDVRQVGQGLDDAGVTTPLRRAMRNCVRRAPVGQPARRDR